jgi:hypothetical protein
LQNEAQETEENCAPLYDVTVSGTPKRATQADRKASMQEAVAIFLRGMASSHLVVLSMMVKM